MPDVAPNPPNSSRAALLALGASTAALQTLAVREGMAVASGNEAVVAMLFGIWMSETALGASIARKHPSTPSRVGFALSVYGVVLIGTLVAARASVALVSEGEVPGLFATAMAAALLLAPACVLSGWVYAQLANPAVSRDQIDPGKASARAYWLDTLGAGVSGAALALFALDHLLPFRIAGIAAGVAFLGAAHRMVRTAKWPTLLVGVLASAVLVAAPIDRWTYRWHAPGQHILEVESSPRGALLVTEAMGQRQVLLQREPVLVPSNHEDGEQTAHLVAALHPRPQRVLVLGIPPGNLLENLLKHDVKRIEVVPGDEPFAAAVVAYAPGGADPKVSVHGPDIRAWVRSAPSEPFDIILVLAGAPTSVADARLFSRKFYESVDRLVAPGGLLAVALPGFAAYATERERVLHSTVTATLRTSFQTVEVLPADRTLYVASHGPAVPASELATTIAARLRARGIDPEFLTDTWLQDRLSAARVQQAERWSARPLPASTDAHPVVYRAALQAALERVGGTGSSVLAVLAFTLLALMATWVNPRSRPVSFSVASTGFAGLSLQLVLMLVVQTAVGALYRDVALVTAAYMGASCVGTVLAMRREASMVRLLLTDGAQVGVAVAVALSVPAMAAWGGGYARAAVVVASMLVGLSTGAQISVATRLRGVFGTGVGGAVYAVDLVGAALAALVTVTFLVPWLGISGAAWSVAGAKLLSAAALARHRSAPTKEARDLRIPVPTLLLLLVTVAIIVPSSEPHLVDWTMSLSFDVIALIVLAGLLAMAFEPPWLHQRLVRIERRVQDVTSKIGISPLRSLVFLTLLPLAALPLGRCYFSVPYLFCHVCPRPCVFGVLRPYVVTTALIANVGDQRFCQRACPLGHAQAAPCAAASSRPRPFGRLAWVLRLLLLALITYLYFAIEADHHDGTEGVGTWTWFYVGRYAVSSWVLGAAGIAIVLSFFLRRPFCETACPIGATSDVVARIEKEWVRRK
jgi:spermidine synthase